MPVKMLPLSRVIVSSPFRYCAAWETAFWRSQFLNQLVCVTATPAPSRMTSDSTAIAM